MYFPCHGTTLAHPNALIVAEKFKWMIQSNFGIYTLKTHRNRCFKENISKMKIFQNWSQNVSLDIFIESVAFL